MKTSSDHRQAASEAFAAAAESFDRCDTDGFVTQWAHGITGQLHRRQAEILDAGGTATFPGLFNEAGQRVRAKRVQGRDYWGNPDTKWLVVDSDDQAVHWINIPRNPASPHPSSKMAKLGFHEQPETAPAKAGTWGSGTGLSGAASVQVIVYRTDDGFPAGSVDVTEGN